MFCLRGGQEFFCRGRSVCTLDTYLPLYIFSKNASQHHLFLWACLSKKKQNLSQTQADKTSTIIIPARLYTHIHT